MTDITNTPLIKRELAFFTKQALLSLLTMLLNNNEYLSICSKIKSQIRAAQHRAMLGANRELIMLYRNIGNVINANAAWGNKFIENLARDIKLDFPEATGFSVRNLKYMAKFARLYLDKGKEN